jgi:dTMP kinase
MRMTKDKQSGQFIVFEGLDGAGGQTQTELLYNYLNKNRAKKLSYPDYKSPVGEIIHQYLHRAYDLSVETQFLLYSTDFVKDAEKIRKWRKEGKIIISDRYFSSTIAYQGQRGFNIKKALKFAEIFSLPKPDLIVYLKVSPEISIKRKYHEKRSLDRNEKDKIFLSQLANFYEKLIKNSVFGKWAIVDGEKPIREVFEEVKKYIKL